MSRLKINGVEIESVQRHGSTYYNMAAMYSASGETGTGKRPGRVLRQKSSELSLLLRERPDAFINEGIGKSGNDKNWGSREMAVLYAKYLGVYDQVADAIGDFEISEYETVTLDGVEVRFDGELYCFNDIVNGNGLNRTTYSNFLSVRNGPGARYIDRNGAAGNYEHRQMRSGERTHWINSDMVVMFYEKRLPGGYHEVKLMLGEYHDEARREFVFGRDIVFNMFSEYQIHSQYPVLGKYRIDWYIPELKLAIEFDEAHHGYQSEQDKIRQAEIERELGCKFVRYKD